MIIDELKHDLKNAGVDQEQSMTIITIIELKKKEVDSRF